MDVQALFSLKGKVALVTGGSRGIGEMIVEGFLSAGCAKVYISSRKADVCEKIAKEMTRPGGECIALPQDISTVDGVNALAKAYHAKEGKLDILVNNAGAAWGADFPDHPESGWDKVVDLNLKSPFFLTQALYPQLKAAATRETPAKIINIASIDGLRLNPQETYSYAASKSGLIFLTRRLAARMVRDSIHVNAIAPGAFASEMNRAARDSGDLVSRGIPSRRIGTPEDMAGVAIYLASRAGDYVIGSTIAVDGGITYAGLGVPASST